MVMALGTAAHRVFRPRMINIGQINSPITARNREGDEPIPIGSGNSKLPEIKLLNFPQPWVNKNIDGRMRSTARPMSVFKEFAMENKIGYWLKLHFFSQYHNIAPMTLSI